MPDIKNQQNIRLLYKNPFRLVEQYQNLIKGTVKHFHTKGFFVLDEIDDIVQSINEKLLSDKLEKIQKQYNHKSYFSTYFSKIVYNLCLEILKAKQARKKFETINNEIIENVANETIGYLDNVIIEEELKRFELILRLFFNDRSKLVICLKMINRIPLTKYELKNYRPTASEDSISAVILLFKTDYSTLTKNEIFREAVKIFNYFENKSISSDALRKWIDARLKEIIRLMNEKTDDLRSARYDNETLLILIQKYFEAKSNKYLESEKIPYKER